MSEAEAQPESGAQEAAETPVAEKLGQLDEHSLSDLLKSGFLDEEEAAPALEGKQKDEPEAAEEPSNDEVPQEEEGESDQPEADESSLTKGVQKRINKLVAAKKAAQAELEAQKARLVELQRELEQTKSAVPASVPQTSEWAESLTSVDQVKKEFEATIDQLLWCEQNPDGGVLPLPDGKELELSQDQVRFLKAQVLRRKEIELPNRFHYLQNEAAAEREVVSDFPWWNKPESEEYNAAQVVLREFPELKKRRADWKHVAGLVVLGMRAYNDLKAKKAAPAAAPIKRAPAQPSVSKAPPASASSVNDLAKAKARFVKDTSSQQGIKDLVKAMGFV
jgi:hypothetical protein